MKNNETYQAVVERVAKTIAPNILLRHPVFHWDFYDLANQILSDPDILIRHPNQELPNYTPDECYWVAKEWLAERCPLLKAGWVRVIEKDT